jgi:hypothetical protein
MHGRILEADHGAVLSLLRRWADLLDSRFVVPGTSIRFGLDPILSLIPGVGELASPAFAMILLVQGVRQGVPKVVLLRMLFLALLDALIGAVPAVGSVGDVFFRANRTNLALLERHSRPGVQPTGSDYAFVFGVATLFGALLALPLILAIWLASVAWHWLNGLFA